MNSIAIQLPSMPVESYVTVDVTVNGHKKHLQYRLELFEWQKWGRPGETRAQAIRNMLDAYDSRWQLVEIGAPSETSVPLMFRRKTTIS